MQHFKGECAVTVLIRTEINQLNQRSGAAYAKFYQT